MQFGLTWPLQRFLHRSVPYGEPVLRGFCWDLHCITLHGRRSLLMVHCESRYTCVLFDLSAFDWERLSTLAIEEIERALLDAGIAEETVREYCRKAGECVFTRTHGRREVAFLNKAWEDVLSLALLVDRDSQRQPILNHAVNERLCRCAGEEGLASAWEHLLQYFVRELDMRGDSNED